MRLLRQIIRRNREPMRAPRQLGSCLLLLVVIAGCAGDYHPPPVDPVAPGHDGSSGSGGGGAGM